MEESGNLKVNYENGLTTSNGAHNTTYGIASTNVMFDLYYPKTVINAEVKTDVIIITYLQRARVKYTNSNINIGINNSCQIVNYNDRVFKEVYGVQEGKLTLIKTIDGRIVPPTLDETYEFDEE